MALTPSVFISRRYTLYRIEGSFTGTHPTTQLGGFDVQIESAQLLKTLSEVIDAEIPLLILKMYPHVKL